MGRCLPKEVTEDIVIKEKINMENNEEINFENME